MDTKNVIATLSQNLLDEVKKIMKKEKAEKSEKGESEADEKREHCSEALKGDQHKIDANKNGKVDAHDFHLLRKKKKVAETYTALKNGEEISEEEVEEAVKEPYAVGMAAAMKSTGDTPPLKKSTIKKGHEIAKKIKEETEDLDEESFAKTVGGIARAFHANALSQRVHNTAKDYGFTKANKGVISHSNGEKIAPSKDGKTWSHMAKNGDSIKSGSTKDDSLTKHLESHGYKINEEVEEIDELSKGTMGRYINKAKDHIDTTAWRQGYREAGTGSPSGRFERKLSKRHKGIETAVKKLTKEDTEVELTQEEIERIEATLADLDEGRGRPPKEGSDAWKKRQEAGAAEQDEPRQHPIQQLERIKRDMRGGGDFKHKDGSTHHVTGGQAAKILDKYHGLKPAEKEAMQKEIHGSHAGLKKHL